VSGAEDKTLSQAAKGFQIKTARTQKRAVSGYIYCRMLFGRDMAVATGNMSTEWSNYGPF
jgi:hypothetical protein